MEGDLYESPGEEGGQVQEGDDPREPVLIVVGAHLRAEIDHRPAAYRLRERMLVWLDGLYGDSSQHPCSVVVCSDVWYLNDASLRQRPTISIGGPGLNALTAFLADKVPSALVIDDVLIVQVDVAYEELLAACWGVDRASTHAAVDAFIERYLDGFMRAVTAVAED